MNILLLEDDVILQEIMEEFLVEKGYEVESFFDGEKALDAIGSGSYDMLLLDVNVPNIDGFEILSYLREIGNTTPAIYITSLAGVEDLKKGFDLGADDYITKPFSPGELTSRVAAVLRRARWPAPPPPKRWLSRARASATPSSTPPPTGWPTS